MTGLRRKRSKANYYMWVGVFFLMIAAIIGLVYFATARIDYVWQWYKLPSAFFYHSQEEITATIEGEVAGVEKKGEKTEVLIQGLGEDETLTVPTEGLKGFQRGLSLSGQMSLPPSANGSRGLCSRGCGLRWR